MKQHILLIFVLLAAPTAFSQSPYTQVEVVPPTQSQSTQPPQASPIPQAPSVPQTAPVAPTNQAPQGMPAPQVMTVPQGTSVPQQAQTPPPNPIAKLYAIYGHGAVPEQPYMDETLKPVASALSKMPFTSYEAVSILDDEIPWGQETRFTLNAKYTVNVTPMGQDEQGAIQVGVRIEMLQDDGTYVDALKAQALAAPNGALLFRGMPLNQGELVVVLLVGMPPDPNQQQGDSQQQEQNEGEQEQQQQQEKEQNQNKENEGEGEEQQHQQNNEGEGEGENQHENQEQEMNQTDTPEGEGEKEGMENLDALLQSLEDIDKKEQKEERNQRDRIDFKGDWW